MYLLRHLIIFIVLFSGAALLERNLALIALSCLRTMSLPINGATQVHLIKLLSGVKASCDEVLNQGYLLMGALFTYVYIGHFP